MTKHFDTLRRVARAADADGRPWEWQGGYPQHIIREGDVALVADCFESPDAPAVFAEFIATFDPPTVLWLLEQIDPPPRSGKIWGPERFRHDPEPK